MDVWPGNPYPLGAAWDGRGTNFALYSESAAGVELCLFDGDGFEVRIAVRDQTAFIWHCYLPGIGPGQIMDSLRYWVLEMRVDGFRFDLAATLARELHDVDRLAAFFDLIQQDPVLSQTKLIAEPWDVGEGGYQVGNFPVLWTEWNGLYRDTMRDFWRGEDHNRSWNCGVEGPTDDPGVAALRWRQRRNFLTTLLLSQGVPMLLGGDEFARTQRGNNNGYCQDNALTWYDWAWEDEQHELAAFTRRLIRLRRRHPVFRRRPRGTAAAVGRGAAAHGRRAR